MGALDPGERFSHRNVQGFSKRARSTWHRDQSNVKFSLTHLPGDSEFILLSSIA